MYSQVSKLKVHLQEDCLYWCM